MNPKSGAVMALSSLQIKCYIMPSNVFASFLFEPQTLVSEVCRAVRALPGAAQGQFTQFGLFKEHEEYQKCQWLEMEKTLSYYSVKNGDMLFYRNKVRPLRVRTLENFVKIVQVDDSIKVLQVTQIVCSKFGLPNYHEYSFTLDVERGDVKPPSKDKVDRERMKYHLNEALKWLSSEKSLREQGITETTVVTLRKKYFFSDQSVDQNDSVQVNLLYVQSRNAILDGTLPCTKKEAIILAALHCQTQCGTHDPTKHVPGFLNLSEFLPAEYVSTRDVESSVLKQYSMISTLKPLEAMLSYIKVCQSLPTYGVTFFPVRQKFKGKLRAVPGLLGIKRDAILVLGANCKNVTCSWPITCVQNWGYNSKLFSLVTNTHGNTIHTFKTAEGEAISQMIHGYVDITLRTTPVYETIPDKPDKPAQGTVTKKTEDCLLDMEGYVAITDKILDKKEIHKPNTQVGIEDSKHKYTAILDLSESAKADDAYMVMQQHNSNTEVKEQLGGFLKDAPPAVLSGTDIITTANSRDSASSDGDNNTLRLYSTTPFDPQHTASDLLHGSNAGPNISDQALGLQLKSLSLQNNTLPLQCDALSSPSRMSDLQNMPDFLTSVATSQNSNAQFQHALTDPQSFVSDEAPDIQNITWTFQTPRSGFQSASNGQHTASPLCPSAHSQHPSRKLSLPIMNMPLNVYSPPPTTSLPLCVNHSSSNPTLHKTPSFSDANSDADPQTSFLQSPLPPSFLQSSFNSLIFNTPPTVSPHPLLRSPSPPALPPKLPLRDAACALPVSNTFHHSEVFSSEELPYFSDSRRSPLDMPQQSPSPPPLPPKPPLEELPHGSLTPVSNTFHQAFSPGELPYFSDSWHSPLDMPQQLPSPPPLPPKPPSEEAPHASMIPVSNTFHNSEVFSEAQHSLSDVLQHTEVSPPQEMTQYLSFPTQTAPSLNYEEDRKPE